jgi:hypothetical protein
VPPRNRELRKLLFFNRLAFFSRFCCPESLVSSSPLRRIGALRCPVQIVVARLDWGRHILFINDALLRLTVLAIMSAGAAVVFSVRG